MKDLKTTITGALLAVCIAVEPIISTGQVNWKSVGIAAGVAVISYLAKDGGPTPA